MNQLVKWLLQRMIVFFTRSTWHET